MKYYSNYWMYWTWNKLIKMVQENYETEEHVDDAICFGSYFFAPADQLKKTWEQEENRKFRKLIVYQSEPLVKNHNQATEKMIANIRSADEIWEYDYQNVLLLESLGFTNVKYKPPLLTNSLKIINNVENPDIDLLFYGSFSAYRATVFREFQDGYVSWDDDSLNMIQNLSFIWAHNLKEEDLDKYIARSKVILSMHPYAGESRQQTTRIFYALCNDKTVVAQASDINYFGDSIYQFSGAQDLGNLLVDLVIREGWRTKPKNYNKHFLNKQARSNFAIFYDVAEEYDWQYLFESRITNLQHMGLFDTADYIHINHQAPYLPLRFNRVNRTTVGQNIEDHIKDFKRHNPDHSIIKVTNAGIEL